MPNLQPDQAEWAEETQTAIRDGIERARELLCEAKLVFQQEEQLKAEPPPSAH